MLGRIISKISTSIFHAINSWWLPGFLVLVNLASPSTRFTLKASVVMSSRSPLMHVCSSAWWISRTLTLSLDFRQPSLLIKSLLPETLVPLSLPSRKFTITCVYFLRVSVCRIVRFVTAKFLSVPWKISSTKLWSFRLVQNWCYWRQSFSRKKVNFSISPNNTSKKVSLVCAWMVWFTPWMNSRLLKNRNVTILN